MEVEVANAIRVAGGALTDLQLGSLSAAPTSGWLTWLEQRTHIFELEELPFRQFIVRFARAEQVLEPEPEPEPGPRPRPPSTSSNGGINVLLVSNISTLATEWSLRCYFCQFSNIRDVQLIDGVDGQSQAAEIEMESAAAAQQACDVTRTTPWVIDGLTVRVQLMPGSFREWLGGGQTHAHAPARLLAQETVGRQHPPPPPPPIGAWVCSGLWWFAYCRYNIAVVYGGLWYTL